MFTAAVMTDSGVQKNLIQKIHKYATTSSSNGNSKPEETPLMTVYDPTTGIPKSGPNRYVSWIMYTTGELTFVEFSPCLGAAFSLLALQCVSCICSNLRADKFAYMHLRSGIYWLVKLVTNDAM